MTSRSPAHTGKTRLDIWLTETRKFPSRARAQSAIKAGLVLINGAPGGVASKVDRSDAITILGDVHDYVSRGALKLVTGLDAFGVDPHGHHCLDLGASTGGFTQVLLRRGAARVYAVDVGAGQLHPQLTSDDRVINLEKTHARDLTSALIPDPPGIIVCDVSFVSIRKVLAPALALANPTANLVALIKPQFELGRKAIGKGGLVRATADQIDQMLNEIKIFIQDAGWRVLDVIDSPITGGDGNAEYLIGARKNP